MKILIALIAIGSSFAAHALEYNRILAEKSAIGFVYKQMNVPMEGDFKRFSSQISFDPAKPAASSARFDIDLTSIDTGAADADEEIGGKLWFNTKVFPLAQFVSTTIKPDGPNRFSVSGKLTMKGKTLDVRMPLTFRQEGSNGMFEGAVVIKRADFAIGEGIWADFGTVANEVEIKFRLLATATPVKK